MVQYFSTLLVGILVSTLILGPGQGDAFSCTEALTNLLPCHSFLKGKTQITISCCHGVYALRQASAFQTGERAVCKCLKQAALSAKVSSKQVTGLEQFCNIRVPLDIDSNFDCNTIKESTGGVLVK